MNEKKKPGFRFCQDTIKKYKLKESDLPPSMRQDYGNNPNFNDIVENNKELAMHHNHLTAGVYLNKIKINASNQINAGLNRTIHQDFSKRKTIGFINRWEDFRHRRDLAVDEYVKVRKRMYRASMLLKKAITQKFLKLIM